MLRSYFCVWFSAPSAVLTTLPLWPAPSLPLPCVLLVWELPVSIASANLLQIWNTLVYHSETTLPLSSSLHSQSDTMREQFYIFNHLKFAVRRKFLVLCADHLPPTPPETPTASTKLQERNRPLQGARPLFPWAPSLTQGSKTNCQLTQVCALDRLFLDLHIKNHT